MGGYNISQYVLQKNDEVFYVVKRFKMCHTFGIQKKILYIFFNFHFLLHKMINASAENIQWQLPRTFHKVK